MKEHPNNVYFKTNQYENIPDEEVVKLIKNGDDEAFTYLCEKYKDVINIKVAKYYIIGAERDDTVQEGMIGLFKAIKNYDETKQNSFKTFANICIERQLITAIKSSNRQKHQPLNSYLSLNNSAYDNDDNDEELINTFDSKTIEDPLDTIMKKEYIAHIESTIDKTLSGFEKQVLNRYIKGESYVDIASKLDAPVKSVDNAIQRIRKKAIKNLYNDV
ncbi:MAG: RNA polymerase sporulation sigma factor SigH [Clostridia bacterium]|nr:RNA polymerase sporulation sigma factor SigH [Clostridia bacterium]